MVLSSIDLISTQFFYIFYIILDELNTYVPLYSVFNRTTTKFIERLLSQQLMSILN